MNPRSDTVSPDRVFGTIGDAFKPLDEIVLSDVRQRGFGLFANGEMRPLALSDLHNRMAEFELHSGVPEPIRTSFDTARNLYVYSWFVYRFGVVAELHAYSTLEAALGMRIQTEGLKCGRGLKLRLTLAKNQGWIEAEEIRIFKTARIRINDYAAWHGEIAKNLGEAPPPVNDASIEAKAAADYLKNLSESIPALRNELAHGGPMLDNGAALPIGICCDLINQLFPVPTS